MSQMGHDEPSRCELERPLSRPNRAGLPHVAECLLSARNLVVAAPSPVRPYAASRAQSQRRQTASPPAQPRSLLALAALCPRSRLVPRRQKQGLIDLDKPRGRRWQIIKPGQRTRRCSNPSSSSGESANNRYRMGCRSRRGIGAASAGQDKGIASFSRTCTAKVRLAKGPYAEGAPGRVGVRWP